MSNDKVGDNRIVPSDPWGASIMYYSDTIKGQMMEAERQRQLAVFQKVQGATPCGVCSLPPEVELRRWAIELMHARGLLAAEMVAQAKILVDYVTGTENV